MENRLSCQYAPDCGGCYYKNEDYSQELYAKKKLFEQIIGMNLDDSRVIGARSVSQYRNKMEFTFRDNRLGLHKRGDYRSVVDMESCLLLDEKANSALKEIRLRVKAISFSEDLRYITFRTTANPHRVFAGLTMRNYEDEKGIELGKLFEGSGIDGMHIFENNSPSSKSGGRFCKTIGSEKIYEDIGQKRIYLGFMTFFQVNSFMYEEFIGVLKKLIPSGRSGGELFDVYAGAGFISLMLSDSFGSLFLVERDKDSVMYAKKNLSENGITDYSLIAGDSYRVMRTKIGKYIMDYPDTFFIFDPPRAGLLKMKKLLKLNRIKDFIYISCNPNVLEKDLYDLRRHYKLEDAFLMDLFPRTDKFEAFMYFTRKNGWKDGS